MGNIMSQIGTYVEDFFTYGSMSKCPNCNSRTILSYPTTVCTKCKNRFSNNIKVVNIYTYHGHYGFQSTNKQYGISQTIYKIYIIITT